MNREESLERHHLFKWKDANPFDFAGAFTNQSPVGEGVTWAKIGERRQYPAMKVPVSNPSDVFDTCMRGAAREHASAPPGETAFGTIFGEQALLDEVQGSGATR